MGFIVYTYTNSNYIVTNLFITNMDNKNSTFKTGLILGAVLGGLTAFFLTPKSGKENREMARKKFEELRSMLRDKKVDEIVMEVYGKASDEGKKLYVKARKELDARLEEMNDTLNDIDKKKYMALVTDVMEHVKGEAEATKDRVTKLQTYLMNRWDEAQSMAVEDAETVIEEKSSKRKA